MSKKLYMVRRDGGKGEYLDTGNADCDSWRMAGEKDLTPTKIACALDQDAENMNWHAFAGCHVKLANLLTKEIGKASATRIMRKLVDANGLHGMNQ